MADPARTASAPANAQQRYEVHRADLPLIELAALQEHQTEIERRMKALQAQARARMGKRA